MSDTNYNYNAFKAYREETLCEIIARDRRFIGLSDEQLANLYSRWSEQTFSASWVSCSDYSIERFVKWATTTPLQQAEESANA